MLLKFPRLFFEPFFCVSKKSARKIPAKFHAGFQKKTQENFTERSLSFAQSSKGVKSIKQIPETHSLGILFSRNKYLGSEST